MRSSGTLEGALALVGLALRLGRAGGMKSLPPCFCTLRKYFCA